jgi:hypothetical protein
MARCSGLKSGQHDVEGGDARNEKRPIFLKTVPPGTILYHQRIFMCRIRIPALVMLMKPLGNAQWNVVFAGLGIREEP